MYFKMILPITSILPSDFLTFMWGRGIIWRFAGGLGIIIIGIWFIGCIIGKWPDIIGGIEVI